MTFPLLHEQNHMMSLNKFLLALFAFVFVCWLELAGTDNEIVEESI